MPKLWFGSSMRPYPEDDPPYYDPAQHPWTKIYEDNYIAIKDELARLVLEDRDKHFDPSYLYSHIDENRGWSNMKFLLWGMKFMNPKRRCPVLYKAMQQTPGLVSIGLSRFAPNTNLVEHNGDTNGTYRCHFGLDVPAGLPDCGIRVGGKSRTVPNGKFVFFNDAHKHTAWNNTDKDRIIMIVDVIRPEFMNKKNMICAFVLARHVSYFYHKSDRIKNFPQWIKTIFFTIALGGIYFLKPVYNLFKWW
jgi:aspartyl/asparaginyl beta-hydroxylase (cupin superfamily)